MYLDRILPTRQNHMCVKWQCVEMPLQWGGLTTVRKCCNVWHLQDQKFALSRSLAIISILFFCFALYFFFSIALFAGGSSLCIKHYVKLIERAWRPRSVTSSTPPSKLRVPCAQVPLNEANGIAWSVVLRPRPLAGSCRRTFSIFELFFVRLEQK